MRDDSRVKKTCNIKRKDLKKTWANNFLTKCKAQAC